MKKIVFFLYLWANMIFANDSFHAIKGGVLSHSTGLISEGIEDGTDLHAELLYKNKLLNGYPTIGTDINLNGDTSFLYGSLTWEDKFYKDLLLGGSAGLAVHNGELEDGSSDRRQLGQRILFRVAVDIGMYFNDETAVSFMYAHYSHMGIGGKRNQGNDNIGLRLSYYF